MHMIDIKLLRNQPEIIRELCLRRKINVDVDRLIDTDEQLRKVTTEIDILLHERKKLKDPIDREKAVKLKNKIEELEKIAKELKSNRDRLWTMLPNLLAPNTPEGKDASCNVETSRWGTLPNFDFQAKTHEVIGSSLGILDCDRGANVAGSGFYYWKGDGARLCWAIFSLANDFLAQRGFIQMFTPIVAKERTFFGTGYLPFFKEQIYKIENEDLCLIGTSEQTLVGYHADEILSVDHLPILYTAFTPCLRTEAGSYGKESRGAFRVHQFHKVEQIVFCRPEESEKWHEQCLRNEEDFMRVLDIPYRVVRVCLGDLGAPAYKKYDVEGWFAGFGAYRETHSNTNLLDYQTRRLNIRCKDGKAIFYPHTISATMITDRAALAILENNQLVDGSVIIPKALRAYIDGREKITQIIT